MIPAITDLTRYALQAEHLATVLWHLDTLEIEAIVSVYLDHRQSDVPSPKNYPLARALQRCKLSCTRTPMP